MAIMTPEQIEKIQKHQEELHKLIGSWNLTQFEAKMMLWHALDTIQSTVSVAATQEVLAKRGVLAKVN